MKKVLSIEQMNKLKELGVDVLPKGLCFMYSEVVPVECRLMYAESVCEDDMKAFDLQDLMELLPDEIITDESNYYLTFDKYDNGYSCYYFIETQYGSGVHKQFLGQNMIDPTYDMLVWVIENGYLKTSHERDKKTEHIKS